jgi:hypothetical protein
MQQEKDPADKATIAIQLAWCLLFRREPAARAVAVNRPAEWGATEGIDGLISNLTSTVAMARLS